MAKKSKQKFNLKRRFRLKVKPAVFGGKKTRSPFKAPSLREYI